MAKLKLPFLLLMLSLTAIFGQAKNNSTFQNEKVPITIIAGAQHSGDDKSSSISASINGHSLYVSFTQNIGNVTVEITNVFGVVLDIESTDTPSGYMYYIPLAGHYTVTFTLENGDEYYGNFEVEGYN